MQVKVTVMDTDVEEEISKGPGNDLYDQKYRISEIDPSTFISDSILKNKAICNKYDLSKPIGD